MFCGVQSSFKMYVHQCLRNTTIKSSELFFCRRLKSLQKVLRPVSLARLSCHSIKTRTSYYEQWRSHVTLNRHQFVCPVYNSVSKNVSNDSTTETKDERKEEPKLSLYQKLKKMYKEYWYVLVPVHLVTSCFWFGSFYYVAASGIDIPEILESLGAPESWINSLKNSKAGNLVLAYTLYKVATPLRYTVTIGGTTISINYLKKWGWVKPVPNRAQIKQMYEEQKFALKDLKATCQDKMQVTKTELLKTKSEVQKQLNVVKQEFHNTMSEARHDIKTTTEERREELKAMARAVKDSVREKLK